MSLTRNYRPNILLIAALSASLTVLVPPSIAPVIAPTVEAQQSPKLEVPKIYSGEDVITKREIFRYEKSLEEKKIPMIMATGADGEKPSTINQDELDLNRIVQVYAGDVDRRGETEILAAGDRNAFVLDLNGRLKRALPYRLGTYPDGMGQEYDLPFISIVDVNNDGKVDILGHGVGIGIAIDLKGKVIWKYRIKEKYAYPDAIVAADVDGDGRNEILVIVKDQIEIFDLKRGTSSSWKWSDNKFESVREADLFVTDFDGDGTNEIVVGNTVFAATGKKITQIQTPYSWHGVGFKERGKPYLLKFERSKFDIFDTHSKRIASYSAPLSQLERKPRFGQGYSLFAAESRWVRFLPNAEKYLVVFADGDDPEEFDSFKMLYIYDPAGTLVYQETMQAFDGQMCVVPAGDGKENLAVTDDGRVAIYSAK